MYLVQVFTLLSASAVRLTHLPTGIIVASQSQRSQHQNKDFAMKVLRAKIADLEREKVEAERNELRAATVGTGDRSEKIRTYNFKDSRVTDHRAKYVTIMMRCVQYTPPGVHTCAWWCHSMIMFLTN